MEQGLSRDESRDWAMRAESPLPDGHPLARWGLPVAVLAILCAGLAVSLFPLEADHDVWWHLKTGKILVDNWYGLLPDFPPNDVFSQSGADKPWVNHEWLADMLMYGGYSLLGLRGLVLVKSLIFSSAFLLLFLVARRQTGETVIPALVAVLAVLSSQWTAYLRPPILTYLFIALWYVLLLRLEDLQRSPARTLAALAALMLVWVNLHGGFILGIVIPAIWAFGLGVERLRRGTEDAMRRVARMVAAIAIAAAASLVNPFFAKPHLLTFHVMGDKALVRSISELQPPALQYTTPYDALVLVAIAALGLAAWAQRGRLRLPMALVLAFFLYQSLNHVRHLPLFALAAVVPVSLWIREAWIYWGERKRREEGRIPLVEEETRTPRVRMVWGLVLAVLIGLTFVHTGLVQKRFGRFFNYFRLPHGYVAEAFPVGACDFLFQASELGGMRLPGNMFNTINRSGYLIWRLSPEIYKVFTDSRFDIHGNDAKEDVLAVESAYPLPLNLAYRRGEPEERKAERERLWGLVESGLQPPYWQEVLNRNQIDFILIEQTAPVTPLLKQPDSGWAMIYADWQTAIFVRDTASYRKTIEWHRDFARRFHSRRGGP